MKKYTFLIIGLLVIFVAECQVLFERPMFDHIWLFGGSDIRMDFNYSPPQITMENRPFNFDATNASICDENGDLLFYTNGIRTANANHEYLENGYRINPGIVSTAWISTGNRIVQGALILQQPDSDSVFHVLYVEKENIETEDGIFRNRVTRLHHGIVYMSSNNQLGTVIEKDFPLILDTLDTGKITACKHGNGNDWWVIIPYRNANKQHRFLLNSNGLIDYGYRIIGSDMKPGLGQATFSPNGKKYINYSLHQFRENYLAIYDFDRCTGLLSNPVVIQNDIFSYAAGVAISENGRFLYEALDTVLYQIDLEAEDIVGSRTKIAIYGGYHEGNNPGFLATSFFLQQLAPNGKIYINNPTSTKHLHTIEEPNKRGMASRVEQHNVTLPTWNQRTLPNYPYYGLGPWDGSPCDTLNINNPTPEAAFEYTADSLNAQSAQLVEFFDASYYAYEWLWDFGDGSELDTLHHPVHTYAQPGTYEVCLTVSNVTGVDTYCDTLYLDVTPTNNVFSSSARVTISPNPVRDVAVVRLEGFESLNPETLQFSLTDASGRAIPLGKEFSLRENSKAEHGQFKLNLNNLPSGIYFYHILEEHGRILASGKVVKM